MSVSKEGNRELEVNWNKDESVEKYEVDGDVLLRLSPINCVVDDLENLAALAELWAYKLCWIPRLHRPSPGEVGHKVKRL